jgi:hypothetical protein
MLFIKNVEVKYFPSNQSHVSILNQLQSICYLLLNLSD